MVIHVIIRQQPANKHHLINKQLRKNMEYNVWITWFYNFYICIYLLMLHYDCNKILYTCTTRFFLCRTRCISGWRIKFSKAEARRRPRQDVTELRGIPGLWLPILRGLHFIYFHIFPSFTRTGFDCRSFYISLLSTCEDVWCSGFWCMLWQFGHGCISWLAQTHKKKARKPLHIWYLIVSSHATNWVGLQQANW